MHGAITGPDVGRIAAVTGVAGLYDAANSEVRQEAAGWEAGVGGEIVVECESDLLEVIFALGATSGFAGLLNGREQQGDEDCDDGNDNE